MIPVAAELICSWRELNERNNKWTGSRQQVTRQQQQFRNRYRSEGPLPTGGSCTCAVPRLSLSHIYCVTIVLSIDMSSTINYLPISQSILRFGGHWPHTDPKFVGQRRVLKSLSGLALRHQNTHTHWRTHTHRETCIHINVVMSI